ncbi:hypothetical protein CkaCkLH20_00440 [Colletotrichum karsti]|uniref:Uncharacterized protein n=1 Tax=Colletotrichum karsti TaxID=1095194 RepID=A0A9P6LNC7_9PEZI|nr:uncharacterized protein CkaCkLH20_00440 [Colletotrichum karsti]KAF9882404.1 hypothetical protein CkaCkLH20_00440 [Colletotrichum karsti]
MPDITIPNTGRSDISKTSSPSSTSTSAPSSTQSDASSKSSPSESLQPGSSTSIPQATTATSSPTPTSTEPTDSSSSGPRLNLGAIVAGILGGLALICITIILVIYIVRNNRSEKSNRPPISRPRPQKPKWSFLAVSKRNTKDSDVSSEDTITLHETPYPDPPDNKAHPEAGWGPSEAYGSEVAPHRGPWEMLNEERSHEMSDHNRPAELPDHAFLETLPTIPQAPTRQDSWRPNDDGAAWGDLRAPPRIRDRLRYASPQTAAAEGLSGNVAAANFAAPGWGRRDDHTRAPVPYGQSADIRRQKTSAGRQEMAQGPAMSDDGMRQAQHRTGGGIPSATASVSSHGSLYTSSPTKF